ncbi:hypothetical protein, partial [Lactobacillus equicursoris]|uniref:hypothetical protein n=2 Tax=Lactobacillus equicursoris TaxID=420645 RepID=UPI000587270B
DATMKSQKPKKSIILYNMRSRKTIVSETEADAAQAIGCTVNQIKYMRNGSATHLFNHWTILEDE